MYTVQNMYSNKINSLDLFRGIAGYGVAISHFYYYFLDLNFFQFLSIFFVEFFFVLSGFVLYPQLLRVYNDKNNLKIFYIRRWLRTIPPYLLALLTYSIFFLKFDSDLIKYLFFSQNLIENFINFDYFTIAWSLSVEEFFYLLFPLFLIFFNKIEFIKILTLFISLVYLLKIVKLFFLGGSEEFYRIGTFLRLDAIAFGVMARIFLNKILYLKINIFFLIISSLFMYFFYLNIKELNELLNFLFILLIQIYSINVLLIFITLDRYIKSKFLINIFSILSKQTYSVYLFHFVVILMFKKYLNLIGTDLILLKYLFVLFVFSTAFYYLFEKDINNKRPNYKKL